MQYKEVGRGVSCKSGSFAVKLTLGPDLKMSYNWSSGGEMKSFRATKVVVERRVVVSKCLICLGAL